MSQPYLRVELKVPLTKEQAEVLNQSDFTSNEWSQLVLGAIRSNTLNENITVLGTELIVKDEDGFVMPEEKVEIRSTF